MFYFGEFYYNIDNNYLNFVIKLIFVKIVLKYIIYNFA